MNEYFFEKIFNFANNLRLLKLSSVPLIIFTGILVGILTFHLQIVLRDFFINLPSWNIPVFGLIFGREYDLFPVLTSATIGLIIWFVLFWKARLLLDFFINSYLLFLSSRQKELVIEFTKINSNDFANTWEIQGSPILRKDGLAFTNSNSGSLIKKGALWWILPSNLKMWKNFKAKLTVNFVRESHVVNDLAEGVWKRKTEEFRRVLGIVFRAQNLEDYFMLEIWRIDDRLSFRPHVRLSGNWDAPFFNSPQSFNLKKQGSVIFTMEANNDVIVVKIGNKKIFKWPLPKLFEANLIQHTKRRADTTNGNSKVSDAVVTEIPFRDRVGMFGFRNYGNELALVKKLVISPIK